ncbi:MAG: HEAT repeat domain-containing protein [Candidatus Muirbacterium halophilum]|nr:HEAT repeat domain-containing protein [Candidatus Muirbacterium halophilum]
MTQKIDTNEVELCKSNKIFFTNYISTAKNKEIIFILKKLGKLPSNFEGTSLLKELALSDNKAIKLEAIKNLAKLSNIDLLSFFIDVVKNENNSEVRREATSAIGRIRSEETIPQLEKLLSDYDPNVILQAIRGLLVFKKNENIKKKLLSFKNHPNEIIQQVINTEFEETLIKKSKTDHTSSPEILHNTVVNGDVLEVLKYVSDESIHLTFTSPPYYNARDYSIYKSYDEYLQFLEKVFKEVHRITKEGRFFILNTSPIIIPRVGRSYSSKRYPIPYDLHPLLIKMGWEFIDDIVWAKPEASAKNRVSGFNQHRKPLAYKPNCTTESVMVYRKRTTKLIDWNIKQYDDEIVEKSKVLGDFETSNLWKIDPVFDKVHSAVFPKQLCDNIVRYYSFIGDLVFDPFGGSGTLGKSALSHQRLFFTTEKNHEYFERIQENIKKNFLEENKYQFYTLEEFKNKGNK